MAALIRLKRKRHDDPTEAVVLSCKKSKATHCGSDVREVFRLAGTFDLNVCIIFCQSLLIAVVYMNFISS